MANCVMDLHSASIFPTDSPRRFTTDVQMGCTNGVGNCTWTENTTILRYSSQLKDWVRISQTEYYRTAACGSSPGQYLSEFPIGSAGRFKCILWIGTGSTQITQIESEHVFP
jgi:hypothetical protein